MTFKNNNDVMLLNSVTLGLMSFIAFAPKVSVIIRKLIFSLSVFLFTIGLNILAPSSGPVLVYFLAGCIYSIIIFDNKYAYWWSHIVLFISVVFGFAIYLDLLKSSPNFDLSAVHEWAAISSNLVFLCYLSSALIPKIFIGIENYINEQKRLKSAFENSQIALQAKNDELEQYAFVASHDLQEPLRMVTSFMHKLSSKYGDRLDNTGRNYIAFAEDGAVRMKQIIVDLLEFSKANKPIENPEKVDLNELLSNYLELRKEVIAEYSAKIEAMPLPLIEAIKPLITQIFHCLLDNALKYAKKGTPPIIYINVSELEKHWEFAISDNGIGIDPQFFDKIFQLFQRLHNRDEYDGTGIGLAVAKRSVEFMGGKIWVESNIGEGSTFYFTIPKN